MRNTLGHFDWFDKKLLVYKFKFNDFFLKRISIFYFNLKTFLQYCNIISNFLKVVLIFVGHNGDEDI